MKIGKVMFFILCDCFTVIYISEYTEIYLTYFQEMLLIFSLCFLKTIRL